MIKTIILSLMCLFFQACSSINYVDFEPATFKVSGKFAVMNGIIDSDIKQKLENLVKNHPEVKTIIMQNVEGSVDDEANLQAGLYVRKMGFNTIVAKNGIIASGGTDFFLAGNQRTVFKGAKIGVHAWSSEEVDDAINVPKNDLVHEEYLRYYEKLGIPTDFYWFTIESASSDDIHWMSKSEQKLYKIETNYRR